MKIEQQVANLELSQRLKELGVKQESVWYWVYGLDGVNGWELITKGQLHGELDMYSEFDPTRYQNSTHVQVVSAFTVAENLHAMPMTIVSPWTIKLDKTYKHITNTVEHQLFIDQFHNKYLVGYGSVRDDDVGFSDTLADAVAEARIWLIESGYVDVNNL